MQVHTHTDTLQEIKCAEYRPCAGREPQCLLQADVKYYPFYGRGFQSVALWGRWGFWGVGTMELTEKRMAKGEFGTKREGHRETM